MLNGNQNNKTPTFSKEDAEKFFKNEYCDKERGSVFVKLAGLPDVNELTKVFKMEELDWKIFQKKLHTRLNKSSLDPNGVLYTMYKRFPRVRWIMFKILCSFWKEQSVPLQW